MNQSKNKVLILSNDNLKSIEKIDLDSPITENTTRRTKVFLTDGKSRSSKAMPYAVDQGSWSPLLNKSSSPDGLRRKNKHVTSGKKIRETETSLDVDAFVRTLERMEKYLPLGARQKIEYNLRTGNLLKKDLALCRQAVEHAKEATQSKKRD